MIGIVADRGHHFEYTAGQVRTGRIGDGFDVRERHLVEPVRMLSASKAAKPPSFDCIPITQLAPSLIARSRAPASSCAASVSTIRITAESSTSGNQSL